MTESAEPSAAKKRPWRAQAARLWFWLRAGASWVLRLARALHPRGGAFVLFCALLLADIAYRLVLIYHLATDPITPFSFVPLFHNVTAIVRCFAFDWAFVASLCLVLGSIGYGISRLSPARFLPKLRTAGWAVAALVTLAAGLDAGAQLRALLTMHTGIDATLVLEAASAVSRRDLFGYAQPVDLALAALPTLLLIAIAQTPARWERLRLRIALGLSVACLLAYLPYLANPYMELPAPQLNVTLRWAPLYYTGRDLWLYLTQGPSKYERLAAALPAIEAHGLFVNAAPPPAPTPPNPTEGAPKERYNVVLVIMESTGSQYVFDTHERNAMPMPRLRSLMGKGLQLTRHYSTSNTSPRAIFSLYTGLYPQPTYAMFVTRPDIRIPGIASFLGPGYDSFFVTPSRLQFYLPHAMLEHDGLREIYGYENMPIPDPTPMPGMVGLDEIPTVDFFLKRLGTAKEPFFATYYSFAPHYDYYDHGPEFRVFSDTDEARHRYYNNLRLLDTQIGRIIDALARKKQLQRTVLIFVGDHGEGFGQHPDDFTHSRHSFDENLRTPALFYQPRLFRPARVDVPTSHVDILPTLLDALAIAHEPTRLQGVSLLRGTPDRKYIYAWGNEGTLSSIERGAHKVQVSPDHDRCWFYDLVRDSRELDRHKCDKSVQPQFENLLRFWKFQQTAIARYNQSLVKAAHPAVARSR